MRFEWAAERSELNLRQRGFDFALASRVFEGPVLVDEDARRDYGELRERAIGAVEGIELVVSTPTASTPRESRSDASISARRANRKERHAYHAEHG